MRVKKLEVEERRRLLSRDYTTEVSLAQGVYRWPARRWSRTDFKRDRLRCAMEYQAFGTTPFPLLHGPSDVAPELHTTQLIDGTFCNRSSLLAM